MNCLKTAQRQARRERHRCSADESNEMKSPTRRGFVGGALGIGCLIGAGFGASVASAQARVAFPVRPMRLSRRLERSLRDGANIVVRRSWQIDFAAQGQGIGITGVQLEAQVDAPASLAPLAEIEQSRSTADMWPMLLSGEGRILAAGIETREEDMAAALREAERIIAQRPLPATERETQRQYLAELGRAGSSILDTMPADLFFPAGEPFRSRRIVDLPSGLTGQFEVTYEAHCAPTQNWLERAERHVVTQVGQSQQTANEIWEMAEL